MPIVKLISGDKQTFEVEQEVAYVLGTIKDMLINLQDVADAEEPVPVSNVEGHILKLILEWAAHHVKNDAPELVDEKDGEDDAELKEEERRARPVPVWDQNFLNKLEDSILFQLIAAANYLDVKGLLEVACKSLASILSGKSADWIRNRFAIVDDFTEEEKDQIRRDNQFLAE